MSTGVTNSVRAILCAALASVACTRPATRVPSPNLPAVVWQYEAVLGEDGNLAVEAAFSGPVEGGLSIEPGAEPFADQLGVSEGAAFHPVGWRDPALRTACAVGCRVRYRFRLKDAAAALADVDLALAAGPTLFAPPSTWLVHPVDVATGRYRFHVTVPPNRAFVTGVRRAPLAGDGVFEASTDDFEESSFAAFGPLRVRRIAPPAVDVVISPGSSISDESVLRWTRTEFGAVTRYIGRPPSDELSLFVLPGTSEVTRGKTLGGGGSSVFLRIGTGVTDATLMDDWVLCHELIHVGTPATDRSQAWFSEGLASYVEPVIRVRAGLVSKEKFWKDLIDGLPQGLPAAGDRGLAFDDSWGRTYWGGALYFLLADLQIRQRTSSSRSLQDVVVAAAAAGNVERFESLDDLLAIGDRATGTNVLKELYARLAKAPGSEDLSLLWRRLGISRNGEAVGFDPEAPDAALRDAVLRDAPRVSDENDGKKTTGTL
jgi:hypothetical protein